MSGPHPRFGATPLPPRGLTPRLPSAGERTNGGTPRQFLALATTSGVCGRPSAEGRGKGSANDTGMAGQDRRKDGAGRKGYHLPCRCLPPPPDIGQPCWQCGKIYNAGQRQHRGDSICQRQRRREGIPPHGGGKGHGERYDDAGEARRLPSLHPTKERTRHRGGWTRLVHHP